MKRYKTAKLIYDRNEDQFFITRSIDIIASSFEDAEYHCKIYCPDLVVCEESEVYTETILVGNHKFNFNYN